MPTIAAGTSAQINLPAGQKIVFAVGGSGVAVVGAADSRHEISNQLGPAPAQFGPYRAAQTISVSAGILPVSYTIMVPPFERYLPDGSVVATVNAAGVLVGPDGSPVSGAGNVTLDTSGPATATANATALKTALAQGRAVLATGVGVAYINDTLLMYTGSSIELAAGLTLRMADGVAKTMVETVSHAQGVDLNVTGITSAGCTATVQRAAHGKAVNDWVSLSGSTSQFYNGTFQVETVPTADTYTVRLLDVPSVTTAAGTLKERAAVSDIYIGGGGTWDGNRGNRAQTGTKTDQMFVLGYCANVQIDIQAQNGIHRVINHGYINGLTGPGLIYENSIGGLISGGPASNMDVERVAGRNSIDDLMAIQGSDYPAHAIGSPGDCLRNKVGRVTGNVTSGGNAIKITGASGFTQELEVGVLEAECAVSDLVNVVNDSGVISSGTNCRRLRIGVLRHINPVNNAASIKVSRDAGSPVLESLVIESARVLVPAGVTYHLVYPNSTNATILKAQLSNIDIEGAAASQAVYMFTLVGEITDIAVSNCRMKNAGGVFNHDAVGTSSGQTAKLNNVSLTGCSWVVNFRRNCTVHMQNVESSSTGTALISSGSAATLTLIGNPIAESTSKHSNLSGSARVTPYSNTLRVAGSFVTGAIGASFWNTDSAWASGSGIDKTGQYGYTGAAWTKQYGPT